MKTAMNIVAIIIKIATISMAIVGTIMTIAMVILAKPAVYHVYDVVEECEDLDPDNETQDIELMSEAYKRTLSDPRVQRNKFVQAVAYGIGRFTSFVANL